MHYYLADLAARKKEPGARALHGRKRDLRRNHPRQICWCMAQRRARLPPREKILPGVTVAALEELATQAGITFFIGILRLTMSPAATK